MVSYAIIHRIGMERYLNDAATAGLDGLIVPDLPVEEAAALIEKASRARPQADPAHHAHHAPRSCRSRSPGRRRDSSITSRSRVSPVSARACRPSLSKTSAWLRTQTDLPICIGFGISGPDQVRELAPVADGLIVGSAIVRRLAEAINRPRPSRPRDRPVRRHLSRCSRKPQAPLPPDPRVG